MKNVICTVFCFILMFFTGCNEDKLEILNYGSIKGTVFDGDTYYPIEGVLITTNPPSLSLLTDSKGQFEISKIKEGEVAVTIKKKDYLSNSLSVAILDGQSTDVEFLMFKDENNLGNVSLYDPVPGNGAIDQNLGILLKWKVEGKKGTLDFTYSIYMFEANSTVQKLVGEDISIQEVMVSGLNYSTTYFWYVVIKYDGNKIAYSPTWSFKTKDPQ